MRKIITPLLYALFLFLVTGISVGLEMLVRSTGIIGEYQNVIDGPLIALFAVSILVFGTSLFWLANRLIQHIEKLSRPRLPDHFRHSFFYYLLATYAIITWLTKGFLGNEEDSYLLLWLGISLVAIPINYYYNFRKPRS